MIETVKNAWKIPELRKKLTFVLFAIIIFRLGFAIYVPFVDTKLLADQFAALNSGNLLGYFNTLAGGGMSTASIFAMSIYPYINASIIIQLLQVAIPALERLAKEGGEEGKKKIQKIVRITTLVLACIMALGYYVTLKSMGVLTRADLWSAIVIIATMMAGSMFVMWLGDQITEKGIGNGISIILLVGIVSQGLRAVVKIINMQWWAMIITLVICLAIIAFIVYITEAERRIPVQYAKRVVGRKQYGGQSTHLPMKVNMSGVMPIIFAQSIASVPATIAAFTGKTDGWVSTWFGNNSIPYAIIYFLLIIFFAYFYSTIQFNPIEVANNLKKNGGYIPGFRPGKPTSEFIQKVLNKITLFGAIYLGIIAVVPILVAHFSKSAALTGISLGGTSIIIVVGVALETVRALEAQMLMRNYKGFLD